MSQQIDTTTLNIADFFEADVYSPYGMAKIVNKILSSVGIVKGKKGEGLPPQMFYIYCSKGYIANDNNKKITKATAVEWTEAYVLKNLKSES
jgi:hypothetical protein